MSAFPGPGGTRGGAVYDNGLASREPNEEALLASKKVARVRRNPTHQAVVWVRSALSF